MLLYFDPPVCLSLFIYKKFSRSGTPRKSQPPAYDDIFEVEENKGADGEVNWWCHLMYGCDWSSSFILSSKLSCINKTTRCFCVVLLFIFNVVF